MSRDDLDAPAQAFAHAVEREAPGGHVALLQPGAVVRPLISASDDQRRAARADSARTNASR